MAYVLGFVIFAALFLAALSLYRYGNIQRQHPLVTLSVLTAWSFSFLIVFAIPLDITATVYRQCLQGSLIIENAMKQPLSKSTSNTTTTYDIFNDNDTSAPCQEPWGMVPDDVFPNLWRIIYWTSQFLTWIIMPLMQSYLKAGDFTIKGKLKSALIDNAIYYGSYLFICGILLIYIAFKGVSLDWQKLKAIASSASNTWGLFLLVLLLGYALVEVPRGLWNHSKPGFTLQYEYFKAAKLSSDKAEAEEHVDDILESLQAASRAVPTNHILRPYVETILRKVPTELLEKANRNYTRSGGSSSSTIVPSEKALIRIHKQVIKSLQTLQRTEALWSVQVEKVLHLEDVAKNMNSMDRRFKSEFCKRRSRISRLLYNPVIDWYWQCMLKAPFLKGLSVITGILSLIVVWSEVTFFSRNPVLSIFANVINMAKINYDFLTIELFSMITLCYLCYCSYSTVFRIKFLNLYYLAPYHQTNEHSLIFSGMLLCRLTPPMCLNFLGLVHMDSHIIKQRIMETYYTQIMGHMDVLGVISDGFNIYFPIVMLAICLATWFSLGSRALSALGFQQFLHNEEIVTELVQEGKDLIAREKRRRQRAEEALLRKRDLSSRNGNGNNDGNELHTSSDGNQPYQSKYRSFRSDSGNLTPSDGLLRDIEPFDYSSAQRDSVEFPRSLSQEINERFGMSTQVEIGFKGNQFNSSGGGDGGGGGNSSDNDNNSLSDIRFGHPPRGIFDDV